MLHRPWGSRVYIVTGMGEEHWYTTDGDTAQELVASGMAEVVEDGRAFVKLIRLMVDPAEVRELVFARWRERRRKPGLRQPDSSAGGGDLGLAPLIGRHRALFYAPRDTTDPAAATCAAS